MAERKNTEQAAAGAGGMSTIAGAAVLAVVLVASAVGFVVLRETPEEAATVDAPAAEERSGVEAPVADTPVAADAPVTDAPDLPVAVDGPRFDLVRVEADGAAVIAGRAVPGAEVTLTLDGAAFETVTADGSGQFAAILMLPPSDAARILGVRSRSPDGMELTGAGTAMIAPFAGPAVAAVDPDATTPDRPRLGEITSSTPVLGGGPAEPAPGIAAAAELQPASPGAAPSVILADEAGVRVLQGPGGAPEAMTELRLDAITYDVAGAVTLAGRAPAEGSVRATLNNQPINMGEVGAGGQWSLDLPDVDPGTYTLRLEQVGPDGRVTGSVETPFLREDPERIQGNPMLVDPGATVITVQQGFTLWGIAEANFGDGIRYVQIFEENRDRIRDPDLIFPGQIFALPDLPRERR